MQDYVIYQIRELAIKYNIGKVALFGSRARGDNSSVSDYDIIVFDNYLSDVDKASFCLDVEEIETLKKIDIVFASDSLSIELLENIKKEAVILYEQTGNQINEL
jgi:uncharacterized protein